MTMCSLRLRQKMSILIPSTFSNKTQNMIRNVAKSFIKRVFSVSHKSFHQDNKEQVKRILAKNNFPVQVVDKLMNEVRDAYKYQHTNIEKSYPFLDNTKPQPRIGPAANSTMITTKTVHTECVWFCWHHIHPRDIRNYPNKLEIGQNSNVVYSIPCQPSQSSQKSEG